MITLAREWSVGRTNSSRFDASRSSTSFDLSNSNIMARCNIHLPHLAVAPIMTISISSPSNNGGKTDPGKTDPTLIAHRVYVFIQKLDNKKHASETKTTEAETGVF